MESTIARDYNSYFPENARDYHGWWYSDLPRVQSPKQGIKSSDQDRYPDDLHYWFQVHVTVEESPGVEVWYGWMGSCSQWKNCPSPQTCTCQAWKGSTPSLRPWYHSGK